MPIHGLVLLNFVEREYSMFVLSGAMAVAFCVFHLTESSLWQQGPVLCEEANVRFLRAQLVVADVPVALPHTNTQHNT